MSIEVALIDFPRLQEQIATRMLASQNVNAQRMTHDEAKDRLNLFSLALFFWPDTGNDAPERYHQLNEANKESSIPIVLVTSEVGKRNVESTYRGQEMDVLVTPLQPYDVNHKLTALLGIHKEVAAGPAHLDVAHINPFIDATLITLEQMAEMKCERTNLTLRQDARSRGDISGVMGLAGEAEGFVAITFPNHLARKIVCKMLQMEIGEETEEDIMDGVGELMNVIAGAAKAELVNTKHSFQLNIPNVIVGGPHGLGLPRGGTPVVVIEFTTEGEVFEVLVCIKHRA